MTIRFTQLLAGALLLFVVAAPKSASAEVVYETLPGEYSFGASGLGDTLHSGFAFRTPPGDAYSIDSVRLNLWNNTNVSNPVFELKLYDDNAGIPGTLKATVGTGLIDPNFEVMEVAIPATPVQLEADTIYWLLANSPGNSAASVSWFYGGETPTGKFTHVRGPVIWNSFNEFLRDADPQSQYLHVEVNASLTNTPAPNYNITASVAVGNGAVTCNPLSVPAGDSSTCTAVPDAGWQVSGWTGSCAAAGTNETCTLDNIQADQTSAVSFEATPLSIVATVAAGNGSVSCDPSSVPAGGSSTCTAVPDAGWQVSGWTGACSAVGSSAICTLDNIQSDQISTVNFEAVPVTTYPIEFTVAGLLEGPTPGDPAYSVVLLNNGGDAISVFSDGTYSFPTELPNGASYDITIDSQPDNQTCSVTNESGTVASAPVTDPAVTCEDKVTPPVVAEAVPVPVDSRTGLAFLTMIILLLGGVALRNRP